MSTVLIIFQIQNSQTSSTFRSFFCFKKQKLRWWWLHDKKIQLHKLKMFGNIFFGEKSLRQTFFWKWKGCMTMQRSTCPPSTCPSRSRSSSAGHINKQVVLFPTKHFKWEHIFSGGGGHKCSFLKPFKRDKWT